MMELPGWTSITKPLLDKMIADVVGYRTNTGEWVSGSFGDSRLKNMTAQDLLWYRQALIDFNNYLYSSFKLADEARKRLKKKKDNSFKSPMLDSAYAGNIEPSETVYGGIRE